MNIQNSSRMSKQTENTAMALDVELNNINIMIVKSDIPNKYVLHVSNEKVQYHLDTTN